MRSIAPREGGEREERSGEKRELVQVVLASAVGQAASSPRSKSKDSWGPEKPAVKAETM